MITIQKYVRAQSLEEAWQLNQNKRNRILGGMLWMRLGKGGINTAIDLCDLGLNTIEETEGQFKWLKNKQLLRKKLNSAPLQRNAADVSFRIWIIRVSSSLNRQVLKNCSADSAESAK